MMKIKKEFIKRKTEEDYTNNIIGSEIKLMRMKHSKTLEEVCSGICSVSYLCKIENNTIKANPRYIEEICERVNLSKENLDSLYQLEKYLDELLISYYYNDGIKINKLYEKVIIFDNYRANIIKMGYYIYHNNKYDANKIDNLLRSLIVSMSDKDLAVYALFSSILAMKNNCFNEAVESLKSILEARLLGKEAKAIIYETLAQMALYTNSFEFINYIKKTIEYHYSLFNFDKVYYAKYLEAIFYMLNNRYSDFSQMLTLDFSIEYSNTLKLINRIYLGDFKRIKCLKYINDFYSLLAMYYYDHEQFINNMDKITAFKLDDNEMLYLKYIALNDSNDNYLDELNNNYYPSALKSNNIYLIRLIATNLAKRNRIILHYKDAFDVLDALYEKENYLSNI